MLIKSNSKFNLMYVKENLKSYIKIYLDSYVPLCSVTKR
jgi:hypothetical protein